MRRLVKSLSLLAAPALVAGCVQDPRQYETPPHTVDVSKGVVTCQLYTQEFVYWDRATQWPSGMSLDEADEICLEEGRKWQRGLIQRTFSAP